MIYICNCCGLEQENWPAITYPSPSQFMDLTEAETENSELNRDFCTINYSDQTDRFIRGILIQKLEDSCESLQYGIWVSLKEEDYKEYFENFENENFETKYYGWFANHLPDYNDDYTINIPVIVMVNNENGRPEVIPYKEHKHEFINDYYDGIKKINAEKRVNKILEKK